MRWGSTLVSAWIPAFAGMTGRGQGCEVPRLRRERRTLSQGSDGCQGVDSWTHLALFGLVYSYGGGWKWGATVASFGPQLTRTRRPAWPCFDCGGLITSGQERQTFNSLPFPSISTHCLSSTRGRDARFPPSRERRSGFAETTHTTNVRLAGRWRNGQLS